MALTKLDYLKLSQHLASNSDEIWTASFDDVERVVGQPLPASAYKHAAWWANQGRGQSLGWESAGYRTARLDLQRQQVSFIYVGDEEDRDSALKKKLAASETFKPSALTIDEAKRCLAEQYGVKPSQIEIVIRG